MDYAKSKYALVDEAASYIESHLKYKWFTSPGTVYDLETLVLKDIKSITTFEPLKEFTKLKSLTFGVSNSRMTIPDLIGLDHAASLESLAFSSKTKINKNIEVISQMINLKSLQLFNVEQTLPDHLLSPLHSLQNVSFSKHNYESQSVLPDRVEHITLPFNDVEFIPDFTPVSSVRKVLLGSQTCQFRSLDSFKAVPDVEEIHLIAPKKLADISYVAQLQHLKILDANFAAVSDLSSFHEHQGIEELRLRGSAVESFQGMGVCPNLKVLYAEKTKLKSVENIREQFPQLEVLWIWETKVKDLHHLADMQTLKNLDVTKLKPKSWDFISTLAGLEILDLCKTSFSDPSLLLNLPNLKKLRLSGSEVDPESSSFKALEEVMLQREGNLIMK